MKTKITTEDKWAAAKAKIEDLAQEQTQADIALVEAKWNHERATAQLNACQARKTTAEKKLATYRASLGQV